jgi:hypothetical protein
MSAPIPARTVNTDLPVFREARARLRWIVVETIAYSTLIIAIPVVVWVVVSELRNAGVL